LREPDRVSHGDANRNSYRHPHFNSGANAKSDRYAFVDTGSAFEYFDAIAS
jgi:hypothetical protein